MSTSPEPRSRPGDDADRLTRLEENAGFADHALEQLAAEVQLLNSRVRELAKRLSHVEASVGKVAERVERAAEGSPPTPDSP